MSFFSDLRERLLSLAFRDREEQEMSDELRFHLEREAAEREREERLGNHAPTQPVLTKDS